MRVMKCRIHSTLECRADTNVVEFMQETVYQPLASMAATKPKPLNLVIRPKQVPHRAYAVRPRATRRAEEVRHAPERVRAATRCWRRRREWRDRRWMQERRRATRSEHRPVGMALAAVAVQQIERPVMLFGGSRSRRRNAFRVGRYHDRGLLLLLCLRMYLFRR